MGEHSPTGIGGNRVVFEDSDPGSCHFIITTMPISARNRLRGTIEETQLGHVMAHVVVRVAQQWRTCSYHSPERLLTLSLGLGSLVKEAISTELLSLDRLKIESACSESSGDPFQGCHPRNSVDITFILMYVM